MEEVDTMDADLVAAVRALLEAIDDANEFRLRNGFGSIFSAAIDARVNVVRAHLPPEGSP